jgi:hypothetical protein
MKNLFVLVLGLLLSSEFSLAQNSWYVDGSKPNGNGSFSSPFNSIKAAQAKVSKGDTVFVLPGTYNLSKTIETSSNGTKNERISYKAFNPEMKPLLTIADRVLDVRHAYHSFESFIFDSQFAKDDIVRVRSTGDHLILKNCEIRNSQQDGIDISGGDSVLIDGCEIHHLLAGSFSNQMDAHGIVATSQLKLQIRNCNIYYCSGDCFQTDPNRGYPLWDYVLIEDTKLWTGPLPENAANWLKGESPGENAIDTKINEKELANGYRPNLVLNNIEAYGWTNNGYISLRAAFNIKEQVDCEMNGIICHDNQLAFRLRGPGSRGGAYVTLKNVLAYNNEITFRPEDEIAILKIFNCTIDKESSARWFQEAGGGYDTAGYSMLNCLYVGDKPSQAAGSSNIAVDSSCFVNRGNVDYHLTKGCAAIDSGVPIKSMVIDLEGTYRKPGFIDIGAFEYVEAVGLKHAVYQSAVKAYPNPVTSDHRVFHLSASENIETYRVISYSGKTVLEGNANSKRAARIDVANLPPGLYTVQVFNQKSSVGYLRILLL